MERAPKAGGAHSGVGRGDPFFFQTHTVRCESKKRGGGEEGVSVLRDTFIILPPFLH